LFIFSFDYILQVNMAIFQFPQSLSGKHIGLMVVLLLILTACGSTTAPAEPTPLPQGMPFDEASTIYEIDPQSTEARFLIGEILRGEPKTVVGNTNQVRGQIAVDLQNPATAAVGPSRLMRARSLPTMASATGRLKHESCSAVFSSSSPSRRHRSLVCLIQ
jgi:hypothetical protein